MEARYQRYKLLGLEVFGVFTVGPTTGPPSPEFLDAWRQEFDLSFELISMSDAQASAIFGNSRTPPVEALIRGDTMELIAVGSITDSEIEEILPIEIP